MAVVSSNVLKCHQVRAVAGLRRGHLGNATLVIPSCVKIIHTILSVVCCVVTVTVLSGQGGGSPLSGLSAMSEFSSPLLYLAVRRGSNETDQMYLVQYLVL